MKTISNYSFAPVLAACSLLSDLTVPYWIIGGWAIDLAVGHVTRDHADVDIMLLERDKHALWNDLPEAEVQIAGHGQQPRRLTLHSRDLLLPTEVFLVQADGTFWVHRRGASRVQRPLADITRHRDGIPFLASEVVLLFKMRSKADRDQHDVETALPVLNAEQRSWLEDTLRLLPRGKTAPVPEAAEARMPTTSASPLRDCDIHFRRVRSLDRQEVGLGQRWLARFGIRGW